ncbi:hypothetical protein OMP43_11255 [Sphingomonas sp. CBMAI 2297]|uniref:hypothetical protein n=1 Tax=Sphingomonas sp. CBMAI 2297 TaxID=2991720 RepID=UPI0024568D80|nr:hypothetical protein [Sphingomonas sp. CBMAI 2297]MDH4744594.1 hypothetical protein [Sphingomonas sp. CBMAI 2297]
MAFWKVDLTTEDGALGAAQLGGYACFVAAALSAFGLLIVGWYLGTPGAPAATMVLGVAAAETVLFAVAGFRLRAGRGLAWCSVAAFLLVLEFLGKLATLNIMGLVINAVLTIGVINGLRGARALRRNAFDGDEAAAIFE